MTRFLKTIAFLLVLGAGLYFGAGYLASCNNEEEMKEEANASTVGIQKGAVPALWTSDGDGKIPPQKVEKKVETPPVEEVIVEQPQEEVQPQPVEAPVQQPQMVVPQVQTAPVATQPVPQAQPAPDAKQESKPAPKAEEPAAQPGAGD